MKSKNNIYIFFIALALAFWNPLTLFLIYRNTPLVDGLAVPVFFTAVFLIGALAINFLSRGKLGPRMSNALFSLSFIGIFLWFLIFVDSLLPLFIPATKLGLVFEPNSQVTLNTVEFQSTAHINSLGTRGPEIAVNKGDHYRILCFGDSWTFGWGVNDADSWPARLEVFLKNNGRPNAEVVNCGQPGTHTGVYKKHLRRAVPVLKPDLVLVGVLQGDDLAQLSEDKNSKKLSEGGTFSKMKALAMDSGKEFFRFVFKNTLKIFGGKAPFNANLTEQWKTSIREVVPKFDPLRKSRYEALPDSVRTLLQSGNLNTVLIEQYVDFPDRYLLGNTPENPQTAWAAEKMGRDFSEMAAVCRANGAKLAFVQLPFNVFCGHEVVRNSADSLNTFLETHNRIDSLSRSIADGAGIPFICLTDGFRALPEKRGYFFRFDGHTTPKGNDEMGREIGGQLLELKDSPLRH